MPNQCTRCTAACGDVYLCGSCSRRARDQAAILAELARDLEVTLTKQGVSGQSGGGDASPLPFDVRASEVGRAARVAVWRSLIEIGHPATGDLIALSQALAQHAVRIAWCDRAARISERIDGVIKQIRRTIDQPVREFAGPCECGGSCFVQAGKKWAKCSACGTEYDAAEMRDYRDAWVEPLLDQIGGPSHCARLASIITGQPVSRQRVDMIAKRGHLERISGGYRVRELVEYLNRQKADAPRA